MSNGFTTRFLDMMYPDNQYLLALGEAVFNFGLVEVSVVHYLDHHEPGFAARSYDMTAVPIMEKFVALAKSRDDLHELAAILHRLAILRNTLLHARPVADDGGVPHLSYAGKEGHHEYSIVDIQQFSELCISVLHFFNQWALSASQEGVLPFDESAFTAAIRPLIEKWSRRQKAT